MEQRKILNVQLRKWLCKNRHEFKIVSRFFFTTRTVPRVTVDILRSSIEADGRHFVVWNWKRPCMATHLPWKRMTCVSAAPRTAKLIALVMA